MRYIKHFFGLRKLKSLLALVICFGLWQLIRLPFPQLESHPIYAYFYAILEMRNSIEMQKRTSWSRIKANVVGFILAFGALALTDLLTGLPFYDQNRTLCQFGIILLCVLLSLNLAELLKCTTLCAIAATTFIICFWHTDTNPYFYATLRFVQTLMSVGVAYVVNRFICKPGETEE